MPASDRNAATSVERTVLDNGVAVLTERVPHLLSATVGIWAAVGSRIESASDSGIAHFIEHMLFKGTARRKAQDISREIDSVGGTMNACTDREYTFFFAKALTKDLPLVTDLLSDIYINSTFDGREFDREKGVILQEILMVEDNPEEYLHDFFHESYWGGHPLGAPVQGTLDSVGALTRDRVVGYFEDRFRRRGIVVTVVGSLPHGPVADAFARALAPLSLGDALAPSAPPAPRRGACLRRRPVEQTHLCLGAPAVSRKSGLRHAAHVLNTILGGSTSSRLFQEIREERGLAYSVYSTLSTYADSGILKICAVTTPGKAQELLSVAADVVAAARDGGIRDDEVTLAKEHIKGNMILSLESPEYRMTRLAMNEMFLGEAQSPEEALRLVDAVTTDAVRDLAAKLLVRDRFLLAAAGDLPAGPDLAF